MQVPKHKYWGHETAKEAEGSLKSDGEHVMVPPLVHSLLANWLISLQHWEGERGEDTETSAL